ncbi:hypothetical protein [Psychromonas aquimarina]|uniref:hypothetical protein n=1 Tax=Psychromonas aquimarina TaxID=444919 RepID=UPI00040857CF|nr:hypothetical protein [Psychromonas aquimarina]
MLTIIILIAISVFLPFFWFITIGYIIYLIATKKRQRDKVILDEIIQSIDLKREKVILDWLYFNSAKGFAADNGVTLSEYDNDPSDDTLIVNLNIAGEDYQVTFQRWGADETQLLVCTAAEAKEKLQNTLDKEHILLKDCA